MKQCIDCGQTFAETLHACPNCGCPAELCQSKVPNPQEQSAQNPHVHYQTTTPLHNKQEIDLGSFKVWCIVVGAIAILGFFIVMRTETVRLQEVNRTGFSYLFLTIGLILIGLGVSIKHK